MTEESAKVPDLRSAAVEGLRWTAVARPAIEIIFLASLVILARLISPAEFGRFAIAMIAQELALLIVASGIGTALVQRPTVTQEHLRAGSGLALVAGVGLAGLAFLSAGIIFAPLFGERTADLVRLSTPLFVIAGASTVPMAILRRRLAFRTLSLIELATSVGRSVVSVALALAGLNAEALVLGGLAAGAVTLAMAWASAPPPMPRLSREPSRDILGFGLPAALASVSWVGFRNCDYAIVGARLGAVQAGFYFRAYTLAIEYQKKISVVIGQVGFPMLARTRSDDERSVMFGRMARLLAILLFPMLALLAVVAPVLVPWLFGEAWEPAVVPTQVLVVGGAATLVIDVVGAELMAAGRARALLGYGIAHFAVYAAAVFVMTPLGLAAVAGAAAAVHVAFLVVAYILMIGDWRPAPRRLWDDLAPATVPCIGLLAVAAPVSEALSHADAPALLHLVVVALVAAPVYLLMLRALFGDAWREFSSVARAVIPRRRRRSVPIAVPETRSVG